MSAPRSGIKKWPVDERPREKLLKHGSHTLAEAELLAILLRTGSGGRSAVDVGREIIEKRGSLRNIASLSAVELMRIPGIGMAKAVELLAAFELGRRVQSSIGADQPVIRTPQDVYHLIGPRLRDLKQEVFYAILLDSKNSVLREVEITRGTLNASLVHPREVFKPAIDFLAASIVVVHNHPSGNKEPSREDIDLTRQLVEAGKVIDIPLRDHVIIGGDGFVSLADRGCV